jgi:hypothetical protein
MSVCYSEFSLLIYSKSKKSIISGLEKNKIEKNKKDCCLVISLSNIKFRLNEAYQIRIIYRVI